MNQVTRQEHQAVVERQNRADEEREEIRRDIKQIRCDTHEVVEMFRTLSGGFKFLLFLGKLSLAITACAGAISIFRKGWFQ